MIDKFIKKWGYHMYEIDWVSAEFETIPIDDERIVKRLTKTTKLLSEHPDSSIPEACGGWAETKAAYRLLNNKKVTHQAIITGHRQQTVERIKEHEMVLCIQDTTSLDYTNHPNTAGLGLYSDSEKSKGLLIHSALAVTPNGLPLGLLSQEIWTRDPEKRGKKHNRRKLTTDEKESSKWLNALDSSMQGIPNNVMTVTVCDREADIYDFLNKAISQNRHLLIRIAQNRRIVEEHKYIKAEVENQPIAGEIAVNIPRDVENKIPPREVKLNIKYCPVTVMSPKNRSNTKMLPNLKLYAVLAEEINPPEGVKPIYWLLLTTLPVNTLQEAEEKIKWYTQRWKIERFHYVLKSGCGVENLQLETSKRLQNAIAIYSIIAWRILWLTYEARENPDSPCETILKKNEWQAIYCVVNNTIELPETPPSMKEIVLLIAKLGGFLARKSDGEPGAKVIWRGLKKLDYIVETWSKALSFFSSNNMGNV